MRNNIIKSVLIIVGVLLMFSAFLNIFDDGVILVYDITAIVSGIGFVAVSFLKNIKD